MTDAPERERGRGHRSSADGSFMIDTIVRGVGRIHMASGIMRESQWTLFKAALKEMKRDERWLAALAALKRGEITARALFLAHKKDSPASLATGNAAKPLVRALADWREATHDDGEVSDDTYRVRKELVEKVRGVVAVDAMIPALPEAIRTIRAQMAKAPRQFNLLRDYARAFARDTVGKRHDVYLSIVDIQPRRVVKRKGRAVTETTSHPLTPHEVAALAAAFSVAWRSKKGSRGGELIAMCLAGTNPKEYFRDGVRTLPDRVHIGGRKVGGRVRDVPRLFPSTLWPHQALATPAITQASFSRALRIACAAAGIQCTPYDMRRTFMNWLEAAGVPRTRRRMYMGHEAGDVSELYERHEVARFLAEDGARLRAWLDAALANARHGEMGTNSDVSPSQSPCTPFDDREVPLNNPSTFRR